MFYRLSFPFLLGAVLLARPAIGQEPKASRERQLKQLLQRFPDADANRDGTLTEEEARAYRAKVRGKDAAQPDRKQPAAPIEPTFADVHYGPHERQVLDFYQAKSGRPTPVIIFIHGGGFVAGDKRGASPAMIRGALEAGISFASINYRFVDGDKTIFPVPQQDGARAVQFIRSQAAPWNVDPARIACYGGSAGAGISMWIGFHDDLAQPDSSDPVARQSTRIRVIGTMGGQGTYDPIKIKQLVGGRAHEHPSLLKVYGLTSMDEALNPTPAVQKLYDEAAAITHLTKDDPPLYMMYNEPDIVPPPDARPGQFIHHPNFGKELKAAMDGLGIENVFVNGGGNPPTQEPPGGMLAFLKKHLVDPEESQ
ncbi:MAG: alpha/beta hydrolase [Planctomycetes bacterium]|nr:alpha/beta hydrolase [Planctomycetota bacterium]